MQIKLHGDGCPLCLSRRKRDIKIKACPPPQGCVDNKDLIAKERERVSFLRETVATIRLPLSLSPNKALWVRNAEDHLQE